ncbi:tetratricopeptide repeat protein [Aporhodopirellula aestuarii]|uniref:Tetratricopeptide repeat protein n=1 Tax=Aporhodopirellula aestuarii TaxID=2950107 RepID=A0ABT0U8X8_9BACT|nr:hypothetical protein [Aporhodopirellula aestuarii]MCM2373149.1 hypothetical protein [Aporhodopirellula aestuarii]
MIRFSTRSLIASTLLATLVLSGVVHAQTDRLYPTDGEAVIGKVKTISKNEIVITAGGKDQSFPSSDVRRLLFQGDPPELTRARELVMDGQYDQAFDELKQIDIAKLPRDFMKADAQFYLVLSQGELALSGQGDLNKSTADAVEFARSNSDSWHFYPAMRLLGDLAKALGNYEKAAQFYGYLRNAPSRSLQIESVYQTGMVKMEQGDLDDAKSDLAKVAGLKPNSAEEKRLQTLAKAAIAVIAAKQGEGGEAIKMVNELIANLNPTDTQTAATIYNAQGASYAALGDDEGALLAYLHTQLMYSMHASEHAEALKKLADLWNKVGKPDRAAQARGELQQRYPGLSG